MRRTNGWSADPAEFARIEPHGFIAKRLTQDEGAIPDPDEQAIGFGAVKGIVRRNKAPGAGHVFYDDGGIAGNMLADVPPDGPSREIIASSRRQSHDKTDRLTLVEVIGRRSSRSHNNQNEARYHSYG
jgi:hypothetical protein